MKRVVILLVLVVAGLAAGPWLAGGLSDEPTLVGFSAESSRAERQWEEKFKAIPNPQLMRDYMRRQARLRRAG